MNASEPIKSVIKESDFITETYSTKKAYPLNEKIEEIVPLIFQTLFFLVGTSTLEQIKQRWIKLLFVKESEEQIIKITRVFSNKINSNECNKEERQRELNNYNVPLNCKNPPRQTELNHFKKTEIDKYLKYLENEVSKARENPDHLERLELEKRLESAQAFWEKGGTGADIIKVVELDQHLKACTTYLDSQLTTKDKGYGIGFVPQKSSKWIAELALPYLSYAPSSHFGLSTDTGGSQSALPNKNQFVIFDDASYSGNQLVTVINGIKDQLTQQNQKAELFLVVPFISSVAQNYLINSLNIAMHAPEGSAAYQSLGRLKIHLITSERPVKVLGDFYKNKNKQGMSITEWKVPDTTSLSIEVSEAYILDENRNRIRLDLVSNYPPCYKSNDKQ